MRPHKIFLHHACIVLSLLFITLVIIDRYNPAMEFLNAALSKNALLVFCVIVIIDKITKTKQVKNKW